MTGAPVMPFLHIPGGPHDLKPAFLRCRSDLSPDELRERDGACENSRTASPELQILFQAKCREAEVAVKSGVMSHVVQAESLDEIQLVYRLLWSADDYVQTRFNQAGFEVFKMRPGDVDGPMDIHS